MMRIVERLPNDRPCSPSTQSVSIVIRLWYWKGHVLFREENTRTGANAGRGRARESALSRNLPHISCTDGDGSRGGAGALLALATWRSVRSTVRCARMVTVTYCSAMCASVGATVPPLHHWAIVSPSHKPAAHRRSCAARPPSARASYEPAGPRVLLECARQAGGERQ